MTRDEVLNTDYFTCMQCKDLTSGTIGDFLFIGRDKRAISPVFNDWLQLLDWMKTNGYTMAEHHPEHGYIPFRAAKLDGYKAVLTKQITDRLHDRHWHNLPDDLLNKAVSAMRDKIRPWFRGRGSALIRARVLLAKAESFEALILAVQSLPDTQKVGAS